MRFLPKVSAFFWSLAFGVGVLGVLEFRVCGFAVYGFGCRGLRIFAEGFLTQLRLRKVPGCQVQSSKPGFSCSTRCPFSFRFPLLSKSKNMDFQKRLGNVS